MTKKVDIPIDVSTRLINHGPVAILSSAYKDKQNVMALAWYTTVSHTPRYIAIAITSKRYSYELIEKSKEFILNIPSVELKEFLLKCGQCKGREVNKIKEFKLNVEKGKKVSAPLIMDCVAHIECRVVDEKKAGDHQIIIGEVVAASANEGILKPEGIVDLEKAQMLHHLGGTSFCASDLEA